jgi:hypothetical protein
MGKLAILGKLWGYVVQFFAKLYGAKMAEADAKYEEVRKHNLELAVLVAKNASEKADMQREIDAMREAKQSMFEDLSEAQGIIEGLELELSYAKKRIANMPASDVWDARLSPNATPPIISGGNA